MQRDLILILAAIVSLFSCQSIPTNTDDSVGTVYYKEFAQTTVRALAVWDDQTVWAGAPEGVYKFTNDGGNTWQTGVIDAAKSLDFRSIAILDKQTVLLLTAGSPAMIFKTTDGGESWNKVFEDRDSLVFFDSMSFVDRQRGVAFGDPLDGCFYILQTQDAGETWARIPCTQLPDPLDGEAGFASSNTCVDTYGDHIWIGTGGKAARILHSADFGKTWDAYATPIIQGGTMTGIYSIDFYDETTGFIAGGQYEDQEAAYKNKASSADGGRTWRLRAEGQTPAYVSCVQYLDKGDGKALVSAGNGGLFYSKDAGASWVNILSGDFTTVRADKSGSYLWFAGKGKLGKMKYP